MKMRVAIWAPREKHIGCATSVCSQSNRQSPYQIRLSNDFCTNQWYCREQFCLRTSSKGGSQIPAHLLVIWSFKWILKWILAPQRRWYDLPAYEQAASQRSVTRAYLRTADHSTTHWTRIQAEGNVQASLTQSRCFRAWMVILILWKEIGSFFQWFLKARESWQRKRD